MFVPMTTVSHTVETYQWRSQVTRASPGDPSVLIGTTELQTTSLNWTMPTLHAGTLVVRPLTAHGATQQMLQCDGNTAASQFVNQVRLKSRSRPSQHRLYFIECIWTNIFLILLLMFQGARSPNFKKAQMLHTGHGIDQSIFVFSEMEKAIFICCVTSSKFYNGH